ncbi:general stress protein [Bacillus tianshenii]|uniref:general stress protein n=1 Tax=Sutcliffiella tianshenii TaxID=1463404 RepID=UPI001CD72D6D|nr:general stress protein [Bacillus tianshenii]MCA1320445.1 general stress protein [Bacillus tianshenii]
MAGHRKEMIGSYLTEQEAMDKINWLKEEGYRSEEIFLIRDLSGVVEPLQANNDLTSPEHHDSGMMTHSNMDPLHASDSIERTFFRGSREDGVASTLMGLGIEPEEAYRYEYDVKVGKVLILTDNVNRTVSGDHSRLDRYRTEEEPALQFDDTHNVADEPIDKPVEESTTSWSVNRPLTDDNIDINRPLDEMMAASWNEGRHEEAAALEQLDEGYLVAEPIDNGLRPSETVDPMHEENPEKPLFTAMGHSHTPKRDEDNSTIEVTEDYDKLLYEHGQPFPMEKGEADEDSYDSSVINKHSSEMGHLEKELNLEHDSLEVHDRMTNAPQHDHQQRGHFTTEEDVRSESELSRDNVLGYETEHMQEEPAPTQNEFTHEDRLLEEEGPLISDRVEAEYTPDLMDYEQHNDPMTSGQLEPGNDYVGEEPGFMEDEPMFRDGTAHGEAQHSSLFEEEAEPYTSVNPNRKASSLNRNKGLLNDKGHDPFNPYRR